MTTSELLKKLRKTLRKLKSKQNKLKEQLEGTTSEHEVRKIKQEIEVLKLQRTKGVRIYKELKRAQEQS